MRVMAVAAVFCNRRMLPQVRATLLGMAIKTGLVQRLPGELPLACLSVRAVATAAVHLALPYRVCERLQHLRALLLVAIEADFRLCSGLQHLVHRRMAVMAVDAGYLVDRVAAGVPAGADTAVVAVEALPVLCLDRGCAGAAEKRDGGPFLAPPHAPRMVAAGPVAGFALQLAVTERATRV